MSARRRSTLSAAVGIAVFASLWQSFSWVALAPASILALVVFLASSSDLKTQHFRHFALAGTAIGAVAGGIGVFVFVLITDYGAVEGWEGVIAIVLGVLGAFAGAIAGMAVGALASLFMRRQ